jgi:transcriptional antiterminator RfaH
MIASGIRWYAVQTKPHAEARAESHLHRQGFVTYLPRHIQRYRHARRVEMVARPLFPRYLFVAIDLAVQRWRAVHSTIGVSHLVCRGADPAPLTEAVIAQLRSQEVDGFVRLPQRPRFSPGEAVRVIDGAFASCVGLYEGMRDAERVAILLDLLGRKVRVVLEGDCVAAA